MSWELFIYTTLGAREAATVEGDLEAALESFSRSTRKTMMIAQQISVLDGHRRLQRK